MHFVQCLFFSALWVAERWTTPRTVPFIRLIHTQQVKINVFAFIGHCRNTNSPMRLPTGWYSGSGYLHHHFWFPVSNSVKGSSAGNRPHLQKRKTDTKSKKFKIFSTYCTLTRCCMMSSFIHVKINLESFEIMFKQLTSGSL